MLSKVGFGKLKYRDQEKNIVVGVFENKNKRKTKFGVVAFTALKGNYKETFRISIPEFNSLLKLIERMPPIEKKK